jgi:hypothetical protein
VWPTNRDPEAFNEVMAATPPVVYADLIHGSNRMAQAHQYFTGAITEWIGEGDGAVARAGALANVLLHQVQVVVIQLGAHEDAQEFFETLNARGTPLSAADLIKNFIFQRLGLEDARAEAAYTEHWQEFETAFWEKESMHPGTPDGGAGGVAGTDRSHPAP